jgi:hypothetical protein
LGFKRIGRVKGCGKLKSFDEPVDAIIYGRELTPSVPEDVVSEERFDKIKFYLKNQRYPDGADRAEKSRLRSAATHYRLVIEPGAAEDDEPVEKLFLKDKEVISDLERQYGLARSLHLTNGHAGINKTTGAIAEKYHWVRIKDTASLVIKECPICNEAAGKQSAAGKPGDGVLETGSSAKDVNMGDGEHSASPLDASIDPSSALSIDHLGYQVPVDPQILASFANLDGDDLLRQHLVDDAFGHDRS